MPLTRGNVCAEKLALCHLCWCWVNKQLVRNCTAEEACPANHTQEELGDYFHKEEVACAAAIKTWKKEAVANLKPGKRTVYKIVKLRKKPAASCSVGGGVQKKLARAKVF